MKCFALTVFQSKTPMLNQILKPKNCSVLGCNEDLKVKNSTLFCSYMPILFSVPSRPERLHLGCQATLQLLSQDPFTLPWERGFLLFVEYVIIRIRQRALHCQQLVGVVLYNREISVWGNFSRVYSFSFYHSHIIFSNEGTSRWLGLGTIMAAILSLMTFLTSCEIRSVSSLFLFYLW